MNDSEGSKTEKPTPKKIKDTQKKGNVAYSHDLSMFIGIVVVIMILILARQHFLRGFYDSYQESLSLIQSHQLSSTNLIAIAMRILVNMSKSVLLIVVTAAVAVMVTSLIQLGGFVIRENIFEFKLDAFNMVANLKQMFSKKNLVKFLFNNLKLLIMFLLSYWLVVHNLSQILILIEVPLNQMIIVAALILIKIIATLLATYLVFAMIDLVMEKRAWYKQLMMSIQEIKDEQKETEGNMEIKQRLRELRNEMMAEDDSIFTQYKDSLMVLANPTHIAILILYLPERWGLPIVLFKAKADLAKQLFRLARKHQIPIIREKSLARKLYELALINQFVPSSLIKEMAEVIARNLDLMPQIAKGLQKITTSSSPVTPMVAKPGGVFNFIKK